MITISLLLLVIAAIQRRRHGTTIKTPFAELPPARVRVLAGLVAILEILMIAGGIALLRE